MTKLKTVAMPLKPSNSHYTDGQWQAIYDQGANILVSASAGSGKTTVLVQRVIEKIKAGTNVDQLLIVTYTEAAAKEMKQRIKLAVEKAITAESEPKLKRHFMQQLSLIPTANISTLHAFCLQVIRNYYYLIQIDPVFRLLTDETEMILLKEDVWEEVREELYKKDQEAFYRLTANFSNDRSDDGLTRLIFSLYDFARSNPNPKKWLDSLGDAYEVQENLAESEIYQKVLKPNLLTELNLMNNQSLEMVCLAEGHEKFAKVHELVTVEKNVAQSLQELIEADDLVGLYEYLARLTFARYPSLRNLEEEEKATNELLKELRNSNKKILSGWQKGLFSIEPVKMLAVMKESQVMVKQMAEVAFRFEQAYSARKAEKNLVDFNDLEHFTLQILATITDDGWHGTEASTYFREKFKEVLVDEYQDINQLQENILLWVRQPDPKNGNFFMVGDVKQSIYSFRLADPTLFITKYNHFGEEQDGRRIILAENFRSRRNVLDFTNLIFEQLMNTSVGQLEYDQAAQLVNGFKEFPESDHYDTELLIFENTNETGEEPEDVDDTFQIDDKTEGELRLVGNKIRELISQQFPIFDKVTKKTRPIRYQDIVLLTPTKKNNLVVLDIFKEMGIPLLVNDTQNYFQATEIRIMIALLNVIDNPYQDIPLASVLRSPMVGLKENQLADIRASRSSGSFYDALVDYHEAPIPGQPIALFKEQLLKWREIARRQPLAELIWQIYQDTGFLDYVGGMPAGAQRQANLHALYERATSYEEMSFKGLFQFVRFIEKMQGKDKDLAEPTTVREDEDAVRVMTIHASKGLEFPVVFVLDLTRRFNLMDLNNAYIFDDKLGAGIKYTDQESRLFYRTLPFLGIREEKRKKLLSEEMRKLYVALTRAEEKLFLVGSYKDQESAWKKWSRSAMEPKVVLGDELRLKSLSLMDWIGLTLMRHADSQQFQRTYDIVKVGGVYQHPAHFKISFSGLEDLRRSSLEIVQTEPENPTIFVAEDRSVLAKALERLDFTYKFSEATQTTSYQSVSEIKRVFEDPDNAELLTLDLTQERGRTVNRYTDDQLAKPQFMAEVGEPQGAEIGTATHLIMQLMTLEQSPTKASLNDLITTLVENRSLAEKVAEKIDCQAILNFYDSDFGQLLLSNKEAVTREQPFSMLMRAERIFADYPIEAKDKILIHGIIDGYFEDSQQLILYDFKTDQLPSKNQESFEKVKEKYRGQLSLYKQALEQVKGRPVTATKLVLLSAGQVLDV